MPGSLFFNRMEAGMENVRRYRATAAMCRQRAALDPDNGWIWLARAGRWENLAQVEIEAHYLACNVSGKEAAAASDRLSLMAETNPELQSLLPQ